MSKRLSPRPPRRSALMLAMGTFYTNVPMRPYTYIPTSAIVTALRKEGVQPFFACQSVVRDQTRHEHTRHMIRLRHEAGIGTKEAKEVVVVNAHVRYSAYNMMAGVLSPMAQHERISRDPREPRTRNTAPW